jgi:glycosyltransferase involved in cell wall biosynthesis
MNSQRHLLVFEPDARGHSEEWLRHLLHHLPDLASVEVLSLAVPPELARRLQGAAAACRVPSVRMIDLDRRTLSLCNSRRLAVSGFARWWTVRRLALETRAGAALFLAIDHLSLPLGLQFGARACRLSGILFRPSVHYATLGPYKPTMAERVRDLRKEILYRLMLRNSSVASVLSLDPFFPAYAFEHYSGGGKVYTLADPVHPCALAMEADATASSPMRTNFLLFGELTERKGLLVLLEALSRLKPDAAERIAVTIAGRIDPPLKSRAQMLATEAIRRVPQLMLRIEDRRLPEDELASFVRHCDVVLAPYQRFVGSSGVLIWAATYHKPVLTQDFGLLGYLVQAYRLGHTLDTRDPAMLAHGLSVIAARRELAVSDPSGTAAFLADKSPRAFVETLVQGLVENRPKTLAHA